MSTGSANPTRHGLPVRSTATGNDTSSSGNSSATDPQQHLLPGMQFTSQLAIFSAKSEKKADLVRHISSLLQTQGYLGLWIRTTDPQNQWSDPIPLMEKNPALAETVSDSLETATSLVQSRKSSVCFQDPHLPGYVVLASFVGNAAGPSDILIGLYPTSNQAGLAFDWTFAAAVNALSAWQLNRFVDSTQHQLASLSSFVNMTAAINRTDNRLEASITLVNELKAATSTSHVALMLRRGRRGPFKLEAMSGVEFFDRNAAMTQTIESTVLGAEEQPTFWHRRSTTPDESQTELKVNLQNFCDSFDVTGCALLPLKDSGDQLFGWLLISLSPEQCGNPGIEKHFTQISNLVSGQMETVLRSQRTLTRVCLDNARQSMRSITARKIGLALLLTTLLMCIPFAYKIPCECELQLTTRRFVAAPYEGTLEKTLVSSGDLVTRGQSMARMDARQLRMQMSGLMADLESERKKRDSALAKGNVAESQIAGAEMARLDSGIAILAERLENTDIRSPLDGVVVSGDMDKVQGAPLKLGQNLFEVGPLDQVLVEIRVPENNIQYTAVGMAVRFEFDAFPFETFSGKIQRIHPRAEVIDNASVFVAEVRMENQSGQLRPGMKGRAKIVGNHYPLGWNLFHGAFETARQWLIW